MGHYHGEWGFETFSKLTPVFKQSRFNGMNLLMPPYRPHVQSILRLMKRFWGAVEDGRSQPPM
jgi:hypothetical protein